jgi:Ser-tRNA(Ala) deacylase AlaX
MVEGLFEELTETELIEKAFVTSKDFYLDTYCFESTAKVTKIYQAPELLGGIEPKYLLITDKTIFHPQGGG